MNECVFCEISANKTESCIIYQTEDVICFLPLAPQVYGHTILAPRQHFSDIYSIPEPVLSDITITLKKLSVHYKEKIGASGINFLHASGATAQQSIFHFHIHLIPRFEKDNLNLWPELPHASYNRAEMCKILRF